MREAANKNSTTYTTCLTRCLALAINDAIIRSLSLAVKYKIEYDSDPSKSIENSNSLFLAQLTFKF